MASLEVAFEEIKQAPPLRMLETLAQAVHCVEDGPLHEAHSVWQDLHLPVAVSANVPVRVHMATHRELVVLFVERTSR